MAKKPKSGPVIDETVDGTVPLLPDAAPGVTTLSAATIVLGEQKLMQTDLFLSVQADEMDRLSLPTATLQISDMLTGRDQCLVHGRLTLSHLKRLQAALATAVAALEEGWQPCSD